MSRETPRWKSYPCQVDDAPASIFFDLQYAERAPIDQAPQLYVCFVELNHPGADGMGTQEEASVVRMFELALLAAVQQAGLHPVARLRNHGSWQLFSYGPTALAWRALVEQVAADLPRSWSTRTQHDPHWDYFFDFLLPGLERQRWLLDRHMVRALARNGIALTTPRPSRHSASFPGEDLARAFANASADRGFKSRLHTADGLWWVRLEHHGPVDLESIHQVTMALQALARAHQGTYHGWEAV